MNDLKTKSKPATPDNLKASAELRCMLAAVVCKHYKTIEDPKGCDGAQMWNGQWWMPLWGCDTLDNMLDDMAYAIARQQAANDPPVRSTECSATIMHQGYIVEMADGGPWLKNDLTWTPIWDERGVWHEITDAELAVARSLSPNAELSHAPTRAERNDEEKR